MFMSTSSTSSHGDQGSQSVFNPSLLSASLADELYEEQQQQRNKHHQQQQQPTFSTFINQPSPRSMASSIASALPFVNARRKSILFYLG